MTNEQSYAEVTFGTIALPDGSMVELLADGAIRITHRGRAVVKTIEAWVRIGAADEPTAPQRPANFGFAMEFLGDPEAKDLLAYIEALERAVNREVPR